MSNDDLVERRRKYIQRQIALDKSAVNVAFAGPDKKTLYVLGAILGLRDADSQPEFGSVYKIPMLAEGYKGRAK